MKPLLLNKIETFINWCDWTVGASVFIPSPHPEGVLKDLKEELEFKSFDWTYRVQVEHGVLGLRIWRIA